jgi:hypothetical protein
MIEWMIEWMSLDIDEILDAVGRGFLGSIAFVVKMVVRIQVNYCGMGS